MERPQSNKPSYAFRLSICNLFLNDLSIFIGLSNSDVRGELHLIRLAKLTGLKTAHFIKGGSEVQLDQRLPSLSLNINLAGGRHLGLGAKPQGQDPSEDPWLASCL